MQYYAHDPYEGAIFVVGEEACIDLAKQIAVDLPEEDPEDPEKVTYGVVVELGSCVPGSGVEERFSESDRAQIYKIVDALDKLGDAGDSAVARAEAIYALHNVVEELRSGHDI